MSDSSEPESKLKNKFYDYMSQMMKALNQLPYSVNEHVCQTPLLRSAIWRKEELALYLEVDLQPETEYKWELRIVGNRRDEDNRISVAFSLVFKDSISQKNIETVVEHWHQIGKLFPYS